VMEEWSIGVLEEWRTWFSEMNQRGANVI
jgi:hypothetical protein